MADPNNTVIHRHQLVICFIAKAANTSIKRAVGNVLGLPVIHAFPPRLAPHRRLDIHLPTAPIADVLALKKCGYLAVATTRHPLARLASCWKDKASTHYFHKAFARKYGLKPGMPFDDFVRFVAETPDEHSDQHFRSMTWDLIHKGRVVPDHVLRIEDAGWWNELRRLIKEHCDLDIGKELHENKSGPAGWRTLYTPGLMDVAKERYAEDLENFGYEE